MKHSFGIAGVLNTLFLLVTHCVRCQGESDHFFGQHLGGGGYLGMGPEFRLWSPAFSFQNTIFSGPLSSRALRDQARKRGATGLQWQSAHLELQNCGHGPTFIASYLVIAIHPRHPFPSIIVARKPSTLLAICWRVWSQHRVNWLGSSPRNTHTLLHSRD